MKNKNQISEEDLEKVNGGYQEDTSALRGKVGGHIGCGEAHNYIGRLVFVISDNHRVDWVRGRLVDSYSYESGCSSSIVHVVDVNHVNFYGGMFDMNGDPVSSGSRYTFDSDEVTLYLCLDEE